MDTALQQLGLNPKEARLYLFLIERSPMTAANIAQELQESRTNTYMILDKLVTEELVELHDQQVGVRKFSAAHPKKLRNLLIEQQQQLRQGQAALNTIMPQLLSNFQLGQHKPGIAYFQGLDGYRSFQENIARAKQPIQIYASNVVPENEEAWEVLQQASRNRASRGTPAQILFHTDAKKWLDVPAFMARGYEVRYWGDRPLEGEIVIYENKVGITAYQPTPITTVITNDIIATTFRAIFEQLWAIADPAV
jgi:hypothetical protein